MIVGRLSGMCAARCRYDEAGVCSVCSRLDPNEYFVVRVPSKETSEAEAIKADFSKRAKALGLDPEILSWRKL